MRKKYSLPIPKPIKWRCSVCRAIIELVDKPRYCPDCKAGSHKIKSMHRISKRDVKRIEGFH